MHGRIAEGSVCQHRCTEAARYMIVLDSPSMEQKWIDMRLVHCRRWNAFDVCFTGGFSKTTRLAFLQLQLPCQNPYGPHRNIALHARALFEPQTRKWSRLPSFQGASCPHFPMLERIWANPRRSRRLACIIKGCHPREASDCLRQPCMVHEPKEGTPRQLGALHLLLVVLGPIICVLRQGGS